MIRVDPPVIFFENEPGNTCTITNEEKIIHFSILTFKFNTDRGIQYAKRTS